MSDVKQVSRDVLYTGRVFNLIVDRVEYPGGQRGVREIAQHPGGAVTVPLLDDGRVVLVRQFRYPLGRYILELPAGKLDGNEPPDHAARRELAEETGYDAGSLEHLTTIYTTPGFCDEQLHLYLARQLTLRPSGPAREIGEQHMTLEFLPLGVAAAKAMSGEIPDAKTIIGLLLAEKRVGGVSSILFLILTERSPTRERISPAHRSGH
jgi:ADP-ribose pyrophosphatase